MEMKKYNVFWEALIISLFIFALGICIGFIIENNRSQQISMEILEFENNLIDARNILYYIDKPELECEFLINKNIEFGDKIYEDAKRINSFESSSQLNTRLLNEQHRKYDVLRTIFWQNSIEIKRKCPGKLDTLVYLYDFNTKDIKEKSKQQLFSNFLTELKYKYGNEIILIPIAKNLDIISLDLMIDKYKLNSTTIILNEQKIYDSPEDLISLKNDLEESRKSIILN